MLFMVFQFDIFISDKIINEEKWLIVINYIQNKFLLTYYMYVYCLCLFIMYI